MKYPRIVQQQWLTHSQLFHVEALSLEFSNGAKRDYERLNPGHDRAVMVLPIRDDDTLILIKEYGAGIDQYHLSFPKGAIDSGEEILDAALRELQEEAGYAATELRLVKQLALSPSYMGNKIHFVVARGLYPSRLEGDEPEPLEVIEWPLSKLSELVLDARFIEAYAMAGLTLLSHHLAAKKTSR
ncbi:ADP-ribose diphosphatase [Sinobacterium caligoides]|uniref:ADP-ribose diphosphatase n=1 Tax=Sinobacterium caligoides TaxID=933926 RepID=A0A3N2DGG5_9GAMM|nr:ADP compounds hydrolase NudE [Sinobacterium caligoides]ROR98882.1 ADP-ribose diphosphatase [Sinobacterium caligoides]